MKKKFHLNCLFCNKETNRTTTKFCSIECMGLFRTKFNLSRGGPKRKLRDLTCLCGKTFYPKSSRIKYCSKHCMGIARKEEWIKFCKTRTGPRSLSLETRKKMSLAASSRNSQRQYTKGIGGIRKDLNQYFRSSWEANIARLLKAFNVDYVYEANIFELHDLNKIYHYRPDFKLNEKFYIEVKGWWNVKSLIIKKLMDEQHSNIEILYIDEPIYKELQNEYKNLECWEYDSKRR